MIKNVAKLWGLCLFMGMGAVTGGRAYVALYEKLTGVTQK